MKQRLDLDGLLKKYEQNYGLSNLNNVPRVQPKRALQRVRTQTHFYPQHNDQYYKTRVSLRPEPVPHSNYGNIATTNFQMSRSQCENLLMSLRAELKSEEQIVDHHVGTCIDHMIQSFERQHQDLRREVIGMVESALETNRKAALEVIQGYRSRVPRQYASIQRTISSADTDIARLLSGLSGPQYKRTIAEVVTRDFGHLLKTIKEQTRICNAQFQDSLRGFKVEKNKLISFQQQLQNIYIWQDQEPNGRILENREQMAGSRRSSRQKIFQSRHRPETERDDRSEKSAPKQMRRTFFNFEQDY